MKSEVTHWTVDQLQSLYSQIEFPEYQREPTVWSRNAKKRLIDSMARDFSISVIYIYIHRDGTMDCVDGRQRLGAIMSFLGHNDHDKDNRFSFSPMNEIFADDKRIYAKLDGLSWAKISENATTDMLAHEFKKRFLRYRIAVVRLSSSSDERDFHLQFARLNLGTILNSGEKLHAMVGEMRDVCFESLGTHPFLAEAKIPTRRYSREQLAAQILVQVFEADLSGGVARTRHIDLQQAFKENATLTPEKHAAVDRVERIFDNLHKAFADQRSLTNRAMVVSTVLLANMNGVHDSVDAAREIVEFVTLFMVRLKEQVAKGFEYDAPYRYLVEFQRHVTQASVEKPAVAERSRVLEEGLEYWRHSGRVHGDG